MANLVHYFLRETNKAILRTIQAPQSLGPACSSLTS